MNRTFKKTIVLLTLCCLFAFLRFLWYALNIAKQSASCDCLWSSAESGEVRPVLEKLEEGIDPNCERGEPLKRALRNRADVPHNNRAMVFLLRHYGAR
jgi:hypothetical protein